MKFYISYRTLYFKLAYMLKIFILIEYLSLKRFYMFTIISTFVTKVFLIIFVTIFFFYSLVLCYDIFVLYQYKFCKTQSAYASKSNFFIF